ncbi:hypothetical protein ACFL0K_00530 [Patescibacteria group bacterium]
MIKEGTDIDKFIFQNRRFFVLIGSVIFWVAFIYIWGIYGWNDAQLGTKWWWSDLVGHVFAGIVLTINVFFVLRNYTSPRKSFRLLEKGYQAVFVVIIIVAIAALWEFFEGVLDAVRVLRGGIGFAAQTHALDTTIDFFVTSVVAIPTSIFYIKGINSLERKFPDQHLKDEIARYEGLGKQIADRISTHDKEVQKTILQKFQTPFKK